MNDPNPNPRRVLSLIRGLQEMGTEPDPSVHPFGRRLFLTHTERPKGLWESIFCHPKQPQMTLDKPKPRPMNLGFTSLDSMTMAGSEKVGCTTDVLRSRRRPISPTGFRKNFKIRI